MEAHVDPKDITKEKTKLDMTPMIDVVFLLIVFFLCTIKFKVQEGQIPAYLPKDVGCFTAFSDVSLERVDIRIRRVATVDVTDPQWIWDENQIEIQVGAKRMSGLAEFSDTIRKIRSANPDAKATLHPEPGSLYVDAVKVIDECLRADLTDLRFVGVPLEAGSGDGSSDASSAPGPRHVEATLLPSGN